MATGIQPGDTVKDTVTGFTGVAICRTEWLNGCVRIGIQPQKLKDGRPVESDTIDETQLELVKAGPRHGPRATGGPTPSPKAWSAAKR